MAKLMMTECPNCSSTYTVDLADTEHSLCCPSCGAAFEKKRAKSINRILNPTTSSYMEQFRDEMENYEPETYIPMKVKPYRKPFRQAVKDKLKLSLKNPADAFFWFIANIFIAGLAFYGFCILFAALFS